jgi:hypothetical protein
MSRPYPRSESHFQAEVLGESTPPLRSTWRFLSSDGQGRRLEDLGRTKINKVLGRPLEEPLNASECASLAEKPNPKNLLQRLSALANTSS